MAVDRALSTFESSGFLASGARDRGGASIAKLVAAKKFAAEEEGATLVEYSLPVALLAAASIAIPYGMSRNINNIFTNSNSAVGSASDVIIPAS